MSEISTTQTPDATHYRLLSSETILKQY